jgi:hypothetical protein
MAENRLISWFRVPDGSSYRIQVSGSDGSFQATAIRIVDPGSSSTLSHDTLVAGATVVVESPKSYTTTVTISFLGDDPTTVTVAATVTKPDGSRYGNPREPHVVAGKKGDQDSAMVLAATAKGGGS